METYGELVMWGVFVSVFMQNTQTICYYMLNYSKTYEMYTGHFEVMLISKHSLRVNVCATQKDEMCVWPTRTVKPTV